MWIQSFLESEGGKIAVIVSMIVFLAVMAFIMHETHRDPGEESKVLISNAFTGLMTLLLTKLGKNADH